jgi:hypothetical protein
MTWTATSWPTRAVIVGVLPGALRPLIVWKLRSRPVTGGISWCRKRKCSTSGHLAPFSRTTSGPNSPRNVLSVWLGPWSWYGQTPTESRVHSHVYVNSSPGATKPPMRVCSPR